MNERHNPIIADPHTEEASSTGSRVSVPGNEGTRAEVHTTIRRSAEDLFAFWHDFENLPRVLKHVESVEFLSASRSRWRVRVSADKLIEWEAEIINEKPNEMIAWRTLEGSDVHHAGSIWFKPAPGDMGTEVKIAIEYSMGKFADFMAKLLRRSPEQQIREDMRHFKQVMETGEIPTTLGQSTGRIDETLKKYQEAK